MVGKKIVCILLLGSACTLFLNGQQPQVAVETIEARNKVADRAFLEWRVRSPHSSISAALRELLTPDLSSYLIQESALSFGTYISPKQLNEKAVSVMNNFLKKIGPDAAKKVKKGELRKLINELIKPEYVFELDEQSTYRLDRIYNEMLERLAERRTPVGTTLKEWALRFLVAESVIIALSVVERIEIGNKQFNLLTPRDQEKALEAAVGLVANRFITNLETVRKTYQVVLPDRIDDAIRYKIRLFLSEKFVAR
ncbi:hypothetical protein H0X06_06650 [Candidatus Dependentiae bacterium]|nr:hypothetical protein [Candidatus Dependentiae bacterium]